VRAISAAQAPYLATPARSALARVLVKDAGGTWRDLTSYPGYDAVKAVEWGEDIDSNGMQATIRLVRAMGNRSLAPLVYGSPVNKGFAPAGSWSPVVYPTREVKIDWTLVVAGALPLSLGTDPTNTWVTGFHGYIDRVETSPDEVTVQARGLEARLMAPKGVFRREKVFSYAQGSGANSRGVRLFEVSTAYVLNELVAPSSEALNDHWYKVTTAGTTAATEPTWPTGSGSTVTSGTCTFTEQGSGSASAGTAVETVMQALLDDVLGAGVVSLSTPSSPSWAVTWWLQKRVPLWDALRMLADQIGWDLRYRWDAGSSSFKLTFAAVPRSKTTPDYTFAPGEQLQLEPLAVDATGIRNVVQVVYSDNADLDAEHVAKRKTVTVSDSASIADLGEQWMELAEDSSSNIGSTSEATAMANAILSDLAAPAAEWGGTTLFFPWVELSDLLQLDPSNVAGEWVGLTDASQKLAVTSWKHAITQTTARTSFALRGKPASGANRWLGRDSSTLRQDDNHQLQTLTAAAAASISATEVVGGTRLFEVGNGIGGRSRERKTEWHVSAASGFTPDSTTLRGRGSHCTVGDLIPGETYYLRRVGAESNSERKVISLPSPQTSFVAGRASAGHLNSDVMVGRLPLNGGFETLLQAAAVGPPDHWSVVDGAWNDDLQVISDANGHSGANWLKFVAKTHAQSIHSDYFHVEAGHIYSLRAWGKGVSGTSKLLNVVIEWFTNAKASESTSATLVQFDCSTTTWSEKRAFVTAPSSARFGRAKIAKATATDDASWGIDSVAVEDCGEAFIAPTLLNSWLDYGSSNDPTGYRGEAGGRVRIRGCVKSGTVGAGTPVFQLPAAYRPAKNKSFDIPTDTGRGVLNVLSGGNVEIASGGNGWAYIDCAFNVW
jgi:hypothetical protein